MQVRAVFEKPTRETRVGIKLGPCDAGGSQITRFSRKGGGIVAASSSSNNNNKQDATLQPGMKLIAINNVDCSDKTPNEISVMLQEVVGTLTIDAIWPDYSSSSEEEEEEEIVVAPGVGTKNNHTNDNSQTPNAVEQPQRPQDAVEISDNERGDNDDDDDYIPDDAASTESGGIVRVTGRKTTPDQKVGIRLIRDMSQTDILIDNIADTSIFRQTALSKGMRILSINGVSTNGKLVKEMSAVIAQAERTVTIEAVMMEETNAASANSNNNSNGGEGSNGNRSDSNSNSSAVVASGAASAASSNIENANKESSGGTITVIIHKKSKSEKVGLRLCRSVDKILVEKITAGGMFDHTPLAVGMEVMSINGVLTQGKTVREMSKLVMQATGKVSVKVSADAVGPVPSAPSSAAGSTSAGVPSSSIGTVVSEAVSGGGIVIAKVKKVNKKQKVGLNIGKRTGVLMIQSITDTSIFLDTPLEVGMFVLSINGIDVGDKSVKDVFLIIAKIEGWLEIKATHALASAETPNEAPPPPPEAELIPNVAPPPAAPIPNESHASISTPGCITVTVDRVDPDVPIGIRLTREGSAIQVARLSDTGLFAGTPLAVGMTVTSVNGATTDEKTVKELSAILASTIGPLTIVAVDPASNPPPIQAVPMHAVKPPPASTGKPSNAQLPKTHPEASNHIPPGSFLADAVKSSPDAKVGVRLSRDGVDGTIVVGGVTETSLFLGKLQTGDRIVSINGVRASKVTVKQLSKVVGSATGRISIVAMGSNSRNNNTGTAGAAAAHRNGRHEVSVTKSSMDVKLGLSIKNHSRDPDVMFVSGISSDGLFANTAVKVNMRIVEFNGQSTSGMTANAVAERLASISGKITLVVEERKRR